MRAANRRRLRELMTAGLVDSFGLAFGWTVFNLLAVTRGGLAVAGLYNAAMLVGVVLSAPVTAWLANRLHGRTLLTATAAAEIVLRVATLVGLLAGWPTPLVAAGVVAMNVVAWAGFAGMRAEVAAVDTRASAMTRYATAIAAIEAAGASAAALLPTRPDGTLPAGILTAAVILYAASLAPQFRAAIGARVPSTRQARRDGLAGAADYLTPAHPAVPALRRHRPGRHRVLRHRAPALGLAVSRSRAVGRGGGRAATLGTRSGFLRMPGPVGAMVAGAVLMLIASGPTRLSVGLAAQLHGHASVVIAAIAFTVGCLLASTAVDLLGRLRLPNTLTWPLWGVGMVIGWVAAPWQLAGLLIAQFLSGVSLTAFEGAMDARVAEDAGTGDVTAALAWSAATRATGGAVAVRALPLMVAAPAVGAYSGAAAAVLAAGGALVWAAVRVMRQRSGRTSGRLLAATG